MALSALIENCLANHPECTLEGSLLPSMLLQISGTAIKPSVRLVKTVGVVERPLRYVCLSYCWGGEKAGMTMSTRLGSYLAGIDTSLLPKTILDAVRVTLNLGFGYLWVDALCIVQDSGLDKGVELNKLSSIYAGTASTLCVMSTKIMTEGFLASPKPPKVRWWKKPTTWHVRLHDAEGDHTTILEVGSEQSHSDLTDELLLSRAWTYQEALLSPRLVMFFSESRRPAFRCSKGTLRTDGGMVLANPKAMMCLQDTVVGVRDTERRHKIHNEWSMIVKECSQRAVSFSEDRFPALMGVVT